MPDDIISLAAWKASKKPRRSEKDIVITATGPNMFDFSLTAGSTSTGEWEMNRAALEYIVQKGRAALTAARLWDEDVCKAPGCNRKLCRRWHDAMIVRDHQLDKLYYVDGKTKSGRWRIRPLNWKGKIRYSGASGPYGYWKSTGRFTIICEPTGDA